MSKHLAIAWLAVMLLAGMALDVNAAEFRDDFSGGLGKWNVPDTSRRWVEAVDGVLRLDGANRSVGLSAPGTDWRDFILSFRMRMTKTPEADGHTGVRLREDGVRPGEIMIFFRPDRPAFTGSGRTESSIGQAPGFSATDWHAYRLTVTAGSVELEIDGRSIGTVRGVQNEVGGLSLYAYNCVAEYDDLVLLSLAAKEIAPKSAWPIDLPPQPTGPAVDASKLTAFVPVTLYADSPGSGPWPVVIHPGDVNLPASANPTSITLLKPNGDPCPTQYDDMDGDERVSQPDEIVALVELEAGQVQTFRLAYTTDQTRYGVHELPGFAVTMKDDGFPRVAGDVYGLEWFARGAFMLKPRGAQEPAIGSRHGDQDQLVLRRLGPLRATVIVGRDIPDNGRFTRRMEAYPTYFEMTCTLAAADRTRGAFVQPLEALHFDLNSFRRVSAVWQRGVGGYITNTEGEGPPVKQWYPAQHGSLAYDLVYPEGNLLIAHDQSPDWTPGLALIGKHMYMSQSIAFGWRPPVPILADGPHVQTTWVTQHANDPVQFRRLEQRLHRGLHVLTPDRSVTFCRDIARRARLLSEALGLLPGASDSAKVAAAEAAKRTKGLEQLKSAGAGEVQRAVSAELTLAEIDLGGQAGAIREALAKRVAGLKKDREAVPARCLLLKAQACAGQARLDLRLEHPARGAERMERAAAFVRLADAYLKRAPRPVVPDVKERPIFPYVTFSEGVGKTQAEAGFDVGHFWVVWGHGFEDQETEPEKGVWRYELLDKPFQEAAESGMRIIPLLNWAPPRWFNKKYLPEKVDPNAPPGSTGDIRLVDPGMLDQLPPHIADFADYIRTVAQRHGRDPSLLVWSVRNEPAYYETGGINGQETKEQWMMQAFRHWVRRRYANVAELNANWGTKFNSLETVEPPKRWEENKAAWYDLMTFKAECLAGELRWEADLATAHSNVKFTGAKFVPACVGPHAARSGYGVDPWITGSVGKASEARTQVQRGAALVDMYLDGLDSAALRTAELHWSALDFTGSPGAPVISCETGRVTKPQERPYRWHYYPDRMASAYAWSLYQYGMYGVHYWTWSGAEEYGVMNWDGSLDDYALEASLANQEMRAARPLFSNLKPMGDIAFFYPRATFVQGGREELEAYENLYHALDDLGYHLRIVSHIEADRWKDAVSTVIVPPAPYLERSALAILRSFAEKGGHVIFTGALPSSDEYLHSRSEEVESMVGARSRGRVEGQQLVVNFGREALRVPNRPPWTRVEVKDAQRLAAFEDGSSAIVHRKIGKGDITWIPFGAPSGAGSGTPLDLFPAKWKFAFGDKWPQAPGIAQTSTEGHIDRGLSEKWMQPDFDDSRWEDMPVPGVWEENGHPDTDGWGWYRCVFRIPADLRGKHIFLQGDTLDDRARVYVNGVLVKETTTWDEKFEVDLTPHLKADGRNVIALCILDTCAVGGVRGNIVLFCPDVPSAAAQVLDKTLRSLSLQPRLTGRASGLVAHVLAGAGAQCLVATNTGTHTIEVNLGVSVPPGVNVTDQLLDLLTGKSINCRRSAGRLVVPLRLPPAETVVLPFARPSSAALAVRRPYKYAQASEE